MRDIWQIALYVLVGGLLGWGMASGQSSALDPVRVAPHIFENVLENDRVRVLKVTERNGETAPLHTLTNRVTVYLSPCAWMESDAHGESRMLSFRLGDVVWQSRTTRGGETSNVVQDCSKLEIELK